MILYSLLKVRVRVRVRVRVGYFLTLILMSTLTLSLSLTKGFQAVSSNTSSQIRLLYKEVRNKAILLSLMSSNGGSLNSTLLSFIKMTLLPQVRVKG
jgi:hypothetical protein